MSFFVLFIFPLRVQLLVNSSVKGKVGGVLFGGAVGICGGRYGLRRTTVASSAASAVASGGTSVAALGAYNNATAGAFAYRCGNDTFNILNSGMNNTALVRIHRL